MKGVDKDVADAEMMLALSLAPFDGAETVL